MKPIYVGYDLDSGEIFVASVAGDVTRLLQSLEEWEYDGIKIGIATILNPAINPLGKNIGEFTQLSPDEGLYSWLMRVTAEAIERGERLESGKIRYLGMKFVIAEGEEFPTLKSIMI